MNSYRELLVWQKSMDLVSNVYESSASFPPSETYGLTTQIRRSVISIPSNIAEGFGRNHSKEYVRFLEISRGSLYELQTQIEIAINLEFLHQDKFACISQKCLEVEKMLNSLITKIKKSEHTR
jgi:four helix bundle protein